VLLALPLAGEALVRLLPLPVPGSVGGLLLLLGWLSTRRTVPGGLAAASEFLTKRLALFLVPPAVGIVQHLRLLTHEWLPVAATMVVGTLTAVVLSATALALLLHGSAARTPAPAPEILSDAGNGPELLEGEVP
jgi:holin-like protein